MRSSQTFNALFKQAKSYHTNAFVCFFQSESVCEVGFVTSKKVGKAVERNFARRRMRELFRMREASLPNGRYVVVAKKPIIQSPFNILAEQFERALRNLQK
ncbi:MAG: ribonuclease P protein component [Helicobacteraceae bacterium]|jgi:ribonuclease P protein component|nr:ribonuclease P protein component [Helicobacteraceae bacterium]